MKDILVASAFWHTVSFLVFLQWLDYTYESHCTQNVTQLLAMSKAQMAGLCFSRRLGSSGPVPSSPLQPPWPSPILRGRAGSPTTSLHLFCTLSRSTCPKSFHCAGLCSNDTSSENPPRAPYGKEPQWPVTLLHKFLCDVLFIP